MVALAERTDTQARIIQRKDVTSVTLNDETFSFIKEGEKIKTMATRGFTMINPEQVSPELYKVAQQLMQEQGIAAATQIEQPANDMFAALSIKLPIGTRFPVTNPATVDRQIVSASLPKENNPTITK